MDKTAVARELVVASKILADDGVEVRKAITELGDMQWTFHAWWHKYDDDIEAMFRAKYGDSPQADQHIKAYHDARSGVREAILKVIGSLK